MNNQPLISRHFTLRDQDPFSTVDWTKRDCRLEGKDGVVFEARDVEAPADWSQLAVDIVASKYFRRAGVPNSPTGGETSVKQVIGRICRTIANEGLNQDYFATVDDMATFHNELAWLMLHQYGAFNSPVWFNVGLSAEYGIEGESEASWAWEEEDSGRRACLCDDSYTRPQSSACFIQSVDDSLEGIYDLLTNEMRLFKYGSGSGTNFSHIRAKGESLSSGGKSSGLMSFLEVLDRSAGSIKSGGTTRRSAKLACLDMSHPEIEDFISWKVREERKAKCLMAGGFGEGMDSEAYQTVSGQNSNNSVRITDEFMEAVQNDGDWTTTERTTGKPVKTYKARELFRKVAEAAWECADPGVLFHDTIDRWNTCSEAGSIHGCNPCGEYHFLDNSACNLASLNLVKFLKADGSFDIAGFQHAVRVFITAQDILVDFSSYPTKEIAENSHKYRPLGLGYSNLGAMLMRLGLPYDSEEGRDLAASITALMTAAAYDQSARLAQKLGPFEGFSWNARAMHKVIKRHLVLTADSIGALPLEASNLPSWQEAVYLFKELDAARASFRNAQVTLLAPCGTIGFVMDCDTTGIEPDFALVKTKKLSGGGSIRQANQSVLPALERLGYGLASVGMVERLLYDGVLPVEEKDAPVFACANDISAMGHLKMMAAVQHFLSGGISKTVNLPTSATVEDIEQLYMAAWKMGIKAVAIYRDGSKGCQPLTSLTPAKPADPAPSLAPVSSAPEPTSCRRRLPKRRAGYTQELLVGGNKVFLRTGEYEDGSLGEVFIDMHKEGSSFRSLLGCFARAVSIGLQFGVPLNKYVEHFTFTQFEPSGPVAGHPNIKLSTSIVDAVFRVLGVDYLKRDDFAQVKLSQTEEASPPTLPSAPPATPVTSRPAPASSMTYGPVCSACGGMTTRNGTCHVCLNCGTTSGCS